MKIQNQNILLIAHYKKANWTDVITKHFMNNNTVGKISIPLSTPQLVLRKPQLQNTIIFCPVGHVYLNYTIKQILFKYICKKVIYYKHTFLIQKRQYFSLKGCYWQKISKYSTDSALRTVYVKPSQIMATIGS